MKLLSGALALGSAASALKWFAILAAAGSVFAIYHSFAAGQAAKGELRVMRALGTENVRQLQVARQAAAMANTRADAALAAGQANVAVIEQLPVNEETTQCGCNLDTELPADWFK